MKKIVVTSILILFSLLLLAQQNEILGQAVKKEALSLEKLESEISYYRELVTQRAEIKRLYRDQDLKSIKKIFRKKTKKLNKLFKKGEVGLIQVAITEQEFIYKSVGELQDQLLYYRVRLELLQGNIFKAKGILEDILTNYPNPIYKEEVIKELGTIYYYSGEDKKYIELYGNVNIKLIPIDEYRLAQALYNLGELEKSTEILHKLLSNSKFKFRAKLMLALVSYQQDGASVALENFISLRDETKPKVENYDFIILTIARLYSEINDSARALAHYGLYGEMHEINTIDDAILFEIGNAFIIAENYDQAIIFYDEIFKKIPRSEYYVSAKFQIALAEQRRGSFDAAEDNLDEILRQNELVTMAMNQKYTLLDKYRLKLLEVNASDISDSQRIDLRKELHDIESALQKTNGIVRSLYGNMDLASLSILEVLEEEYKSYVSTMSNMSAVIKLANNTPNNKITKIIDNSLAYSDSSEIMLEVIRYIGHLTSFSADDYAMAKNLAYEKIFEKSTLAVWTEVEQLAISKGREDIVSRIKVSKALVQDNLRTYDLIAQMAFSGTLDDQSKEFIDAEIAAVAKNRIELRILREDVIKNFNKRIASKLSKKRSYLVDEFAEIEKLYDKSFDNLMTNIKADKENYEITYLELLFEQTRVADREYKEYQGKIINEQ